MARRELRRKITATVLTVTALCGLLGVCVWLLLGSNVFSDTIRIMMLVCTVVLGVATLGLLVAKVQEIRALKEVIRSEDAQQHSEAETPRPELAPLQTLDHTTIELPPLPDIPAPAVKPAPQPAPRQTKQQPKAKQSRNDKKRGRTMEQPAAKVMAPVQPMMQSIEVEYRTTPATRTSAQIRTVVARSAGFFLGTGPRSLLEKCLVPRERSMRLDIGMP